MDLRGSTDLVGTVCEEVLQRCEHLLLEPRGGREESLVGVDLGRGAVAVLGGPGGRPFLARGERQHAGCHSGGAQHTPASWLPRKGGIGAHVTGTLT